MPSPTRLRARAAILPTAAVATAVVAVISASAGAARPPGHAAVGRVAASAKPYVSHLSYTETNPGRQHGAGTVGIRGKGGFSATLGKHAALEVAIVTIATGVPITRIVQGGTYAVQRDIAPNGTVTGLAVARFKAHGLGTVCLSYTEKPGKFKPGLSFAPMSGTLKTVGGTGAGATWRLAVSFKQTNVTSSQTEQFTAGGAEQASTSRAKGMSAACKRVAALPH